MVYLLVFIVFYMFGSISPAVITGKLVKGIDIRDVNSKNAGASNALMTIGVKWGILVGLLDMFKGVLPILILRVLFPENDLIWFIGGASAVFGHVFPFYMGFRGGKGTATFTGVVLAGAPLLGLVLGVVLIIVTLVSDYVAIGTLFYIILAPIALYFLGFNTFSVLIVLGYSALSFYKHFNNFVRIYRKQEVGLRQALKK